MALLATPNLRPLSSPYLADLCGRINTLEQNARETVLMWKKLHCFCVSEGVIYAVVDGIGVTGFELADHQIIKIDVEDGAVIQEGPVIDTTYGMDEYIADNCFVYDGKLYVELSADGEALDTETGTAVYQIFDADTLEYLLGPTAVAPEDTIYEDQTNGRIWLTSAGIGVSGAIDGPGGGIFNFLLDPDDLSVASQAQVTPPMPSGNPYLKSLWEFNSDPQACRRYIGPIGGNWFTHQIDAGYLVKLSGTGWPNSNASTVLGSLGSTANEQGGLLRFGGGRVVWDTAAIFARHHSHADGYYIGRLSATPAQPATVLENFFFDKDQGWDEAYPKSWEHDDGKLYVLGSESAPTVENGHAIIVLDASTMEEEYRIEGNIRKPYETLTEWTLYGPGADAPENQEVIGTFPTVNAFLEYDGQPYICHGANIRDMRLAIDAVCVYYKNTLTGEQFIPPGTGGDAEDPVDDNLYTVAVDDARSHYWNWPQFVDPPSGLGDRMVKGWPSISFFEIQAMIVKLEASATP